MSGHPRAPLSRVVFRNVDLSFAGGGTDEDAARRPESVNDIPNPGAAPYPVYGLFLRHVRDASIDNVRLRLDSSDARPALLAEHSRGIDFQRLIVDAPSRGIAAAVHDTQALSFTDCRSRGPDGEREISTRSVAESPTPFSTE